MKVTILDDYFDTLRLCGWSAAREERSEHRTWHV